MYVMQSFFTLCSIMRLEFFFLNDPAATEIYTLSLHDALPICSSALPVAGTSCLFLVCAGAHEEQDRKSTRLNSSHVEISYAVFCLKKKNILSKRASPCVTCCAGKMTKDTYSTKLIR